MWNRAKPIAVDPTICESMEGISVFWIAAKTGSGGQMERKADKVWGKSVRSSASLRPSSPLRIHRFGGPWHESSEALW